MAYGYDGNMSALDWLEEMGLEGLKTLRDEDRKRLLEAGIVSKDGTIHQGQFDLALRYKDAEVSTRVQ